MRGNVPTAAAQRIARLLFLIGLVAVAYIVLSIFDQAARADEGATDRLVNADPAASVEKVVTGKAVTGKAVTDKAVTGKATAEKVEKAVTENSAVDIGNDHAAPKIKERTGSAPQAEKNSASRAVERKAVPLKVRRVVPSKVREAAPPKVSKAVSSAARKAVPPKVSKALPLKVERLKAVAPSLQVERLKAVAPSLQVERLKAVALHPDERIAAVHDVVGRRSQAVEARVVPALQAAARTVPASRAEMPKAPARHLAEQVASRLPSPPAAQPLAPQAEGQAAAVPGERQAIERQAAGVPSTTPTATAVPAAPTGSDLTVARVRCDFGEPARARHDGGGLSPAPATPPRPASPSRPDDQSAGAGHLRDSGGGTAPVTGTVPSTWWPEIPAAAVAPPANASTPGRTVRYCGPPS